MAHRLRTNIFANYAGRAWGVVSIYLFTPLTIKFLGLEAYGIVGFYSVLMSILVVTDFGLTATLSRQLAWLNARKDENGKFADFLRTSEIAFLALAAMIAILVILSAGLIAEHWLRAKSLPADMMVKALKIMGASISLHLCINFYQGGLLGLQKQVLSNGVHFLLGTVRNGGAVLVLWLVSPTLQAFFWWQLGVNLLFVLGTRHLLWRSIPDFGAKPAFHLMELRKVWRYAGGMMGISIISTLLTQTDKIIISKLLPLEQYSLYSIAGAVGQVPILLAGPLAIAVFPYFTELSARDERLKLTDIYHRSCQAVTVLLVPIGLALVVFSRTFIAVWTHSPMISEQAALPASFLLMGSLALGLLMIPYNLALAFGYTRLNLVLGLISLVLIVPLLLILVPKLGNIGGGISWMVLNIFMIPVFMIGLHKKFLRGEAKKYFREDLGIPLGISGAVMLLGYPFLSSIRSDILTLALVAFLMVLSISLSVLALPSLRQYAVGTISIYLGKRRLPGDQL